MTRMLPSLVRRPAASHGYGVFTDEPLKTGDYVLTMSGKVLPVSQVGDDVRAMQIGPYLYLVEDIAPGHDGSEPQYLDNYLNHSCEPNVGFLHGTLELYALRDIAAGEELLWDYSSSMNAPGWSLPCYCGSAGCRGRIQSFCDLTQDQQRRLRSIALAYLRS
jgi:SET domain-containing protein